MSVSVVYLCRKANGVDPLRSFLAAYENTLPDEEHTLVLALKGFSSIEEALGSVPESYVHGHQEKTRLLLEPDEGYDVATYRRVARQLSTDHVCFLNSWSRPLHKKWLGVLLDGVKDPKVGVVGCTGSHEGIEGNPFPNPHIRTNAFCIRRELFLEIAPHDPSREASLNFEAGKSSMTKQLLARDLECVVASTKGLWQLEREPLCHPDGTSRQVRFSNTFRWGEQRDLLVSDNRTEAYHYGSSYSRAYLQQLAWGRTE